jgi:hypothetical protein
MDEFGHWHWVTPIARVKAQAGVPRHLPAPFIFRGAAPMTDHTQNPNTPRQPIVSGRRFDAVPVLFDGLSPMTMA